MADAIIAFLQGVLFHSKLRLPSCNILQWTGRRSITYVRSNQSDCFESLVFFNATGDAFDGFAFHSDWLVAALLKQENARINASEFVFKMQNKKVRETTTSPFFFTPTLLFSSSLKSFCLFLKAR